MEFIIGFAILLVFQVVGEILVIIFDLPLSGPVAGMMLFFVVLFIRGKVDKAVSSAVTPLLNNLSLLFIPAGVGIMLHFDLLANEWDAILITLLISTVLMLVATAALMHAFTNRGKKGSSHG